MRKILFSVLLLSFGSTVISQENNYRANVSGNVESVFQYLTTDTSINAFAPEQKAVLNSYSNINYSLGSFKAGVRFESYLPSVAGYPAFYSGTGIGYRFVEYTNKNISAVAGNFYEQFGSGMIFRSYEERALGLDNAMDGAKLKFTPMQGVYLKAVFGRQRYNFDNGKVNLSEGIVRGIDGEVNLNDVIPSFAASKLRLSLGGSFVSKYQGANNDTLILPKNVGSYGMRFDAVYGKVYLNGEYVVKENDPSKDNNYIYNKGHGAIINLGYSQKGFAVLLSAKSIDNMSFRSDRSIDGNQLYISYIPALTKNHTYNLVSTLYPYASVPLGEIAYQLDVLYKIPKKSLIGGKYGTTVSLNVAAAFKPLQHESEGSFQKDRIAYEGNLFDKSDSLYHFDFNIELKRKFSKKFKLAASYYHFIFNNEVNNVTKHAKGYIKSDIIVLDGLYKISRKHSVRAELQALFTKKDNGNWATALVEYNISPNWFFSVMDQYNYGNTESKSRVHYILGSFGYTMGPSRFMFSYGKQREGIVCVGGVCRPVPATNGLTFLFTTSF